MRVAAMVATRVMTVKMAWHMPLDWTRFVNGRPSLTRVRTPAAIASHVAVVSLETLLPQAAVVSLSSASNVAFIVLI